MNAGSPRKHHTLTAGLIARFAQSGRVTAHNVLTGRVSSAGPRAVGYQLDYWGSPDLAEEVEERFTKPETAALRVLKALQDRWPLNEDDRAWVAQFIAIQVVRMPSFMGFLRHTGLDASRETIAEGITKWRLTTPQRAYIEREFASQRTHLNSMMRQIPRIATLLWNMNWAVIEFENGDLITGDQPLVMLPPSMSPATITPASAIPAVGAANMFEGRFTLDPRHLLLMTWRERASEPWLPGTIAHAASVNCAVRDQALEAWFETPNSYTPFRVPPTLEERIYPISTDLFPGYSVESAGASQLRIATDRELVAMIDSQETTMRRVTFKKARDAA
jgi:hypothetical protein